MLGTAPADLLPEQDAAVARVKAAREGDARAYQDLVEWYQPHVYATCYALTGNPGRSEELAQEVFVNVWRHLAGLKDPRRFPGWLFIITRNRIRRAQRRWPKERLFGPGIAGVAPDATSPEPSPLDRMIQEEEARQLWSALARIPESYRIPLCLVYREGQSIEAVAAFLDLTVDNVRHRLWRGRRSLRRELAALQTSGRAAKRSPKAFAASVMATIATVSGAPRVASAGYRGKVSITVKATLLGAAALLAIGAGVWWRSAPAPHDATRVANVASGGGPAGVLPVMVTARPPAELLPAPATHPPGSRALFSFDFEDGVLPEIFSEGYLVPGPPRAGSRHCLIGSVVEYFGARTAVALGHPLEDGPPILTYDRALVISFDYWLGKGTDVLYVEIFDTVRQLDYHLTGESDQIVHEAWAHARLRASDFRGKRLHGEQPPRMVDGDALRSIFIAGSSSGGTPFYVDNVRVYLTAGGDLSGRSSFRSDR